MTAINPAHIHLLLNHVPVLAVALGLLVLAGAVVRRHPFLMRCALVLFVAAALAAVPTYLSGEPAEEIVERAAGDIERWVEPHEEAAAVSLALVGMLGLVSIAGLWLGRRSEAPPRLLTGAIFVLALTVGGSLAWTANLGGQIRHTEIRAGAPASSVDEGEPRGSR